MNISTHRRFLFIPAAVLLILCSFVVSTVFAGAFEKELGSDDVAIAKKVELSLMSGGNGVASGIGPVAYLPALGAPPKRVALISFYVWDTGNLDTFANYKYTSALTGGALESIPTKLYEAGITPLKETFSSYGMQLLTPKEFLDTPEKQAAYGSFKVEYGAFAGIKTFFTKKAGLGAAGGGRSPSAEAEGFRLLELPTASSARKAMFESGRTWMLFAQGGDGKLFQGLGHDLSSALGVDAVMIIYNVLRAEKKSVNILGTYAYMFGPNPVHVSDTAMVWTGHQYSGVYLWLDLPLITTDKKGMEIESDFPGYAHVARALGIATGDYLKERTTAK